MVKELKVEEDEVGAIYVNGSCITKYWIYNEEHQAIAHVDLKAGLLDKQIAFQKELDRKLSVD